MGHRYNFSNNYVLQSLKIVFIIANSADPDEMPPIAAFHLGFHCMPKLNLGVSSIQKVNPFHSDEIFRVC